MWVLLVVLALVPTVGMATFAVREAAASADARRRAAAVADDVGDLTHLLRVGFALTNEQLPTQSLLRIGEFGLTAEMASSVVGVDITVARRRARRSTDAELADLSPSLRDAYPGVAGLRARLDVIRARADAPGADADAVHDSFQVLAGIAERAASEELAALTSSGGPTADRSVSGALRTYATVVDAFRAAQRQPVAMVAVLFEPRAGELQLALADTMVDHGTALAELERDDADFVRHALRDFAQNPAMARLDRSIEAMVADPAWLLADQSRANRAFTDSFVRIRAFADLAEDAGRAALEAARAAEAAARDTHRRTIAVSVVLAVVAVGSSFMVARSITAPLRRLAQRSANVGEGGLAVEEPFGGAPREVQTVARALGETAGNLRRVGEQARALAAGRLDDEVLVTAVPGALGQSVHASVARLSTSLREQEQLRRRLDRQAHHDSLTGLVNRTGFLEAAEQALARAGRSGRSIAMLLLDLDGFKRANDSHGHQFGDAVLCAAAERLAAVARSGDTLARLAGDEFVLLAEPVGDLDQIVRLGERLIAAVSRPFEIDGRICRIGGSVGVAVHRGGGETAVELLAEADQAVFRAKAAGRGRVDVFNEELRREITDRNEIEDALRDAIPAGELRLHYQPVVETGTGRLRGFEALVRWERPGHGLLPPAEFVPVAEAGALVADLGRWVLREATSQFAAWSDLPAMAGTHLAVNISGRHLLSSRIVDDVRDALDRSGLPPERLVVEVTEAVLQSELNVAIDHLEALRSLGVRVALDDFGTGHTSIGQLGALPVDILKIDLSFVAALHRDHDRSVVELMVGVAHTLGLTLVAEGVEDADQLATLRELSCDEVQGFLVSPPMPLAAARAWAEAPPALISASS